MSASAEEWLKNFKAAEKELSKTLSQKDPTFIEIDNCLNNVRTSFENLTFASFEIATSHDAESRLWDHHSKINSRYRRQLAKFHNEEGKKRPVERRKLEDHYVKFIKSSIRFYRGYIQRLASRYGNIPELTQVASRFKMDTTSINPAVSARAETRAQLLRSCHATLVRLGDLSRYRETETKSTERNWGPARGYYDLAITINPSSGLPHNQLAVIALADGHHVRALYQLYRAMAVHLPHPSAKGNLDIEFKKIIQLKAKNELFPRTGPSFAERTVEAWFSYLHAMCEKGEEWPEHEDIENELLSQMSVLLKEKPLETQLQRFVLTNMAAEFMASQRAREDKVSQTSILRFQFFQRLNIKTFFMLLQILLPELAREDESGGRPASLGLTDRLNPITRRILPSLRQYSSWLLSNASFLVAQGSDPFLGIHIREFWKIYANALTLLAGTFPVRDLPVIEYLLDEDEDTLGFLPVCNENTTWRYYSQSDSLRPRYGENDTSKELPHVEMLFRVREFLANGMELTTRTSESGVKSIPIELVQGARFVYQEDGLPRELHSESPDQHSRALNREDIERDRLAKGAPSSHNRVDDERSTAPSTSNNTMANMVNQLVESETAMENSANLFPGYPSSPSFPEPSLPLNPQHSPGIANHRTTITARDLVKNMQQPRVESGTNLRPVSSLSASIWTPRPGETASSPKTRPGTAHHHHHHPSMNDSPASTPLALPPHTQVVSSGFFNDQLARQHQAINDRSSSINPIGTPSSWYGPPLPPQPSHDPPPPTLYAGYNPPGTHHHHAAYPSSQQPMRSSPWSPFHHHQQQHSPPPPPSSFDHPHSQLQLQSSHLPPSAPDYGAIGQSIKSTTTAQANAMPPSGQGRGGGGVGAGWGGGAV